MVLPLMPLLPLAAVADNWSQALDPQYLFSGLPAVCKTARLAFVPVSFVMLVVYLKNHFVRTGLAASGFDLGEYIKGVVVAIVCAIFIANIPWALNTVDSAMQELATKTGNNSIEAVVDNMMLVAEGFSQTEENLLEDATIIDPMNPKYTTALEYAAAMYRYEKLRGVFNGTENRAAVTAQWSAQWTAKHPNAAATATAAAPADPGMIGRAANAISDTISTFFITLVKLLLGGFIKFLLWLCQIVVYFFSLLRYMILQLSSVLLPVFIAGLVLPAFRNQSSTYIGSILGVLTWPLGWALGHMGTAALFGATIHMTLNVLNAGSISVGSITDASWAKSVGSGINLALWSGASPVQFPVVVGALVTAALGGLLCCIWVILVTFGYPKLIQKVMAQGALMFDSLAKGTTSMALAGAGAAMRRAGELAVMNGGGMLAGGGGGGGGAKALEAAATLATGGAAAPLMAGKAAAGGAVGAAEGASAMEMGAEAALGGGNGSGGALRSGDSGDADGGGSAEDSARASARGNSGGGGGGGGAGGGSRSGSGGGGRSGGSGSGGGRRGLVFSPAMALGRTLENLAAWDGDPESAHRVGDTAFDETRNLRSQEAMAGMGGIPQQAESVAASADDAARTMARQAATQTRTGKHSKDA